MSISTSSHLVLNWHLTEACNYNCQYCYAAWTKITCPREVVLDPERTEDLLSELYQFFRPGNRANPLSNELSWQSVRLNLAGGEPLLHAKRLPSLVDHAHKLGFEVSMISNGSRLTPEILHEIAPKLTWLGLSLDSAIAETNKSIGRIDSRGRLLDLEALSAELLIAREKNPQMRLKLNTVVNRLNHEEDLSALIHRLSPDKWKVLRMLPVVNGLLAVTDEQFAAFVARHGSFANMLCVENNQDMRESYIMVDPHGRFFQNNNQGIGDGYSYSQPILDVGAETAFAEMTFDAARYCSRYAPVTPGVAA